MNSVAVIPVRDFASTKLRLRSILDDRQRAKLTATLLKNVLHSIEKSNLEKVVVVAANKEKAERDLAGFSKLVVIEESSHDGGVNRAMFDGIDFIERTGKNGSFFFMPSDLPLLTSEALNKVLRLLEGHDIVIAGSRKKDGTNLLAMIRPGMIPMHYDDDSFTKHLIEAEKVGMNYICLEWPEFAFDVDDRDDLEDLMQRTKAISFAELLEKLKR
ncbi:MAG: 2-phospho-L-lactate guanylyltransferase [Thaumarchaeota archaeon]|nr:2-phospho-L-lactate guanylyltransferase [Nitrososphaerota archaeon]